MCSIVSSEVRDFERWVLRRKKRVDDITPLGLVRCDVSLSVQGVHNGYTCAADGCLMADGPGLSAF